MSWTNRVTALSLSGMMLTGLPAVGEDPAASPTWKTDIAPIIHRNCTQCHRPGQVGPFSLITFEDVAKRANFVLEAVDSGYMPPWPPVNDGDRFHGKRSLSEADKARLRQWVADGTPRGEGPDPVPPRFPDRDWQLGKPDLIVSMSEPFTVPAENRDIYRAFVIPYDLRETDPSRLETARIPHSGQVGASVVEVLPGNRQVLHHAILYVDTSGRARALDAADPGPGYETFGDPQFEPAAYLGTWVPGADPVPLPPGIAEPIPLEGDLVVLAHYSPTGKPETDQSRFGIHISDHPILRATSALRLGSFALDIPPGQAAYRVTDRFRVPADVYLIAVFPHMHYLGKSHRMWIAFPGGEKQVFLEIPDWDFNWQKRYLLKEPILLPAGTVIHGEWIFDNSSGNPSNPHDPPKPVRFGAGSSDEMCELNIEVIPVELGDYERLRRSMERHVQNLLKASQPGPEADKSGG